MRILIAYDSLSGNTHTLAKMLSDKLESEGYSADFFNTSRVSDQDMEKFSLNYYDIYFLGTWTTGMGKNSGRLAPKMKKFVGILTDKGGNIPNNVAVFGTGDAEFGHSFCAGAKKLGEFMKTEYDVLIIEQRPDNYDFEKLSLWVDKILKHKN